MRKRRCRGRPMKSDKIRVKAEPRSNVDIEKLAQALVSIAKNIAENKTASLRQKDE